MSSTYSQDDLNQLSRAELQSLARREKIKANMKSAQIIAQLSLKYPEGVPINALSTPPALSPRTPSPTLELKRELMSTGTRALLSPTGDSLVGEPALSPTPPNLSAHLPPCRPTIREVYTIQANLIGHVNGDEPMRRSVAESEILLVKSFEVIGQSTHALDQTVCLRTAWECQLLDNWKSDSAFYDGTGVYPPGVDKEKWDTWVAMRIMEDRQEQGRKRRRIEEQAQELLAELDQAEKAQWAAQYDNDPSIEGSISAGPSIPFTPGLPSRKRRREET